MHKINELMKNIFRTLRRLVLCAAVVCPLTVSCDGYDDTELRNQIDQIVTRLYELEQRLNAEIGALKDMLRGQAFISNISTDTKTGITTVTLSNGKTLQLLPEADMTSYVTYIDSGGVLYWAYIDEEGKKQFFHNEKMEAVPVLSETPEVITRDDETYLVIGGVEYPMSGNSVFSDYELIADEYTGEVYAVTFTFGEDMSFTVTVDGAAGFMFVKTDAWSQVAISEQFVALGTTAMVQYQSYGVVDYLLQIPDGWRVKAVEDALYGNSFEITAPSADLVQSGIAAGEGELKVIAVLQGGKAMVAKLNLTSQAFKAFGVSYGNANVKMYNGLYKFAYGVCETSAYDEAAIYEQAVKNLGLYDYPAGYGMSFYDLENEPLSKVLQSELVPGKEYVFWALPAFYDEDESEYYLQENTFEKTQFTYATASMEIVNQSSRDAKIDIEVLGAQSYYFGLSEKDGFDAGYVAEELSIPGYHTPKTELTYTGSVFSFANLTAEPSTEYVAWIVIVEDGKTYTAADLQLCEFATEDLKPGSAVKVVADVKPASLDITAKLTAEGGEMIYYAFLSTTEAKKYADDAARVTYLFDKGWYAPASEGVEVLASSFIMKIKPETSMVFMALATDSEGKYSELVYMECKTLPLQYNDIKVAVELTLNTPEKVTLAVSATGGEAVEYLYWIGKTSDNTWKSPNYLGGNAETAQNYMYLNATTSRFTEMNARYPVKDGVITVDDHTPGIQYVIVIMAKDKDGIYSKATELKFTPYSKNIGNIVLDTDPKWAEAKPTITWARELFAPSVGMMQGTYGFDITLPAGYTAYVLTATDYYFTNGEEPEDFGPIPVDEKILTIIEWTDKPRDVEKVVDIPLYEEKGYPFGHEFYHYEHGAPTFGNAVIWASKEYHDAQCTCVEMDVEKTAWNGEKYIQHHVLTINDGSAWRFEQYQATGNKEKVVDRVFVVLQDKDGNCYQAYEWDVPVEYFANAKTN